MAFAREYCRRCQGYGLIRVRYHTKEPLDIAICTCHMGDWWKKAGEQYIRLKLTSLRPENRIGYLEDFDEPAKELTPAEKDAEYVKGLMR